MAQGKEQYLAERSEYHLRVPKVPGQTVDVFGRDIDNGNYGLSADKIDTLISYLSLQRTLRSFEDLTFSPEFLRDLPEDFRGKLGENLFPGIALADLEIPTTDKVLLAQMLAADRLTETLAQTQVEVWVTPEIQKELEELGCSAETGLQKINYGQLSLKAKHHLVEVMERQEFQVHTILAARQRFPDGVPPLGLSGLLSGKRERTRFNTLTDFEAQYKVSRQVLDNPMLLLFSQLLEKSEEDVERAKKQKAGDEKGPSHKPVEIPINVEEEARRNWWSYDSMGAGLSFEDQVKVADYLRPLYANKTIFEILDSETPEKQKEIFAAFWRASITRNIDFGDEPWMIYALYLKEDGVLELHFKDDLYSEREIDPISGQLEDRRDVAMTDQAVKWIREEMKKMESVKERWEKSGFEPNPTIEVTLAASLRIERDSDVQDEIEGLPKWFMDALTQEVRYYNGLLNFTPGFSLDDPFSLLDARDEPKRNMLKTYFELENAHLERNKRLIINPAELYADLDLDPTASQDEVKQAYGRIAKETKAIHISSPEQFKPEEWQAMNDRFIRATRAYSALWNKQFGETRVSTLGRLTSYFEEN